MKESDIRPTGLMDEQKRLYQADVQLFVSNKNEFQTANCPACNSQEYVSLLEKFGLNYDKCSSCRTVFLNPRPTAAHIQDYYSNSQNYQFWAEQIFPASEEVRREQIFKPRVAQVVESLKSLGYSKPRLLEVGAGFGIFSEEAQKTGYFGEVIAVEPMPYLAEKCKSRGLSVIEKFIEDIEFDRDVDVIVNFEVIEHLLDPKTFLKSCFDLLVPGGVLIITCPNFEGFDVLLLGGVSDQLDTEHINMFNLDSFGLMLRDVGFEVTNYSTPGKLDVDIVKNKIASKEFEVEDNLLLDFIFNTKYESIAGPLQQFLVETKLSSNMQFIARKPKAI